MSTDIEPKEDAAVEGYMPPDMDDGLEDFGTTDMVMPRLNIDHDEAVFVDTLTGEKFENLRVVLLGLVKQRILWGAEVDDGDKPLCKAYTFDFGHPDTGNFPWKASGFDKSEFPGEDVTLPCAECALKEWDSHPTRKTPWCSEQYTLPLLMEVPDRDGEGMRFAAPAILTLQRSGIKPARAYFSAFKRAGTPLFVNVTEMTLKPNRKGSVDFATPQFTRKEETERESWPDYSGHYTQIRGFLTSAPSRSDGDSSADEASSAPSTDDNRSDVPKDDDDLPF